MGEGPSVSNSSEQLIKRVKPIIAWVGTVRDFAEHYPSLQKDFKGRSKDDVHNVDYDAPEQYFDEKVFLDSGLWAYVISTLDDKDKFSEELHDCTGLIVAGTENGSNKNISFLSHQNPEAFKINQPREFVTHLREQLEAIQKRCILGTIDPAGLNRAFSKQTVSN